ncbi:MAG: hypothetical protein ACI9F9_001102 [Candidatus Paceibacteria bacterium]
MCEPESRQVLVEAAVLLVSWDAATRSKTPTDLEFRSAVERFEGSPFSRA